MFYIDFELGREREKKFFYIQDTSNRRGKNEKGEKHKSELCVCVCF